MDVFVRGDMGGHTVLIPVVPSSSGRLLTCSVICTSVRGMRRVRTMLRRVSWRRSSRWRSLGPLVGQHTKSLDYVAKRWHTYFQPLQPA